MSDAPAISVVIPSMNGATPHDGVRHLDIILTTLGDQTFRDFDVTVVDNGSEDGAVGYLERNWPDVRVIALGRNMGFAHAVNRGIGATGGELVALLNDDVELSPDWLERLRDEFAADPRLGFATGKILRYHDRDRFEQAGQDLYLCGRFHPRGLDERDVGQFDQRRSIAIASAAAVLYRRVAIEEAGGFDDDYFIYCEDADLCLRMLLAGYRGLYVPEPKAFHVQGGTVGVGSDFSRFQVVRNALTTMLKDLPARDLLRALAQLAVYQWHQWSVAAAVGYRRTMLRAYASFLRQLPGTLRKRRRLRRSAEGTEQLSSLVLRGYPVRTRLGWLVGGGPETVEASSDQA